MQHPKQLFWTRFQLLARVAFNTRNHATNQPARLAHLDDGNHSATLVQGDEGSAQVIWLGHQGTPSVQCSDDDAISSPPAHSISPLEEVGFEPSVPRRERVNSFPCGRSIFFDVPAQAAFSVAQEHLGGAQGEYPRLLQETDPEEQKALVEAMHRRLWEVVSYVRLGCWRLGPLTPSARSGNLIAGDGTEGRDLLDQPLGARPIPTSTASTGWRGICWRGWRARSRAIFA